MLFKQQANCFFMRKVYSSIVECAAHNDKVIDSNFVKTNEDNKNYDNRFYFLLFYYEIQFNL